MNALFFNTKNACSIADIHIISKDQEDSIMNIIDKQYKPIIAINEDVLKDYISMLSNIFKPFILFTISSINMDVLNECPLDIDKMLSNSNLIVWFTSQKKTTHWKVRSYPLGPLRIDSHITQGDVMRKMFNIKKKNELFYDFTSEDNVSKYLSSMYDRVNTEEMDDATYYRCLETYKFCVVCPSQQQHQQVWEALLSGVFPIVVSSSSNDLYINLPVVFINNWFMITPDFLKEMYTELTTYKKYSYEKLYKYYWLNEIIKYKNS
tara:strand:+ start:650 stop:1441 length:792 start_codon:yes stop_codon:yes gene_type:complete